MHRARLLEKLVPAFARVRGLMQFNQYHKYTVDEHSLLAVREGENLAKDQGTLGTVYAEIHQKDLLHLALLLHDLGKGKSEDHSEVGKVIAQKTSDATWTKPTRESHAGIPCPQTFAHGSYCISSRYS